MKVLLVDDSKAARFAMRNLLEKQGLEVEMAESGEDALEKLASTASDVVFMDQSMPGMGGLAATEQIKSNKKTAHIPVVICTGNEGSKLEQMANEAGAIGVLTKPPQAEKLQEILQSIEAAEPTTTAPPEIDIPAEAGADTQKLVQSLVGLQQTVAQMEKGLLEKITHAAQSTDAKVQPLQDNLSKLQNNIEEQIKDHIKADGSNQRIQLEALRQQVESGLEDMSEREAELKKEIASTTSRDMMTLLNQRLGSLKDSVDQLHSTTESQLLEMQKKLSAMQRGILVKAGLIAIIAAGAAFAAAFFLFGG